MHDLEIRGAGEVLGESQSGEIQEVGFNLYAQMLERAVRALKSGRPVDLEAPLEVATEINLHAPALLPETYCDDVHERLTLYKRMANCESPEDLEALLEELVDRFGLPPEPARALLECHALRIAAKPVGVTRVDATHETAVLHFVKQPPIDGAKIIALVQKRKDLRLSGPQKLRLEAKMPAWSDRAQAVKDLLAQLAA
jgi:transcription-repair coupling factor (superfamily II helicase)